MATRRKNPIGALKAFPFKQALVSGAVGGAGLLGINWLFNKGPVEFLTSMTGFQKVFAKNGALFLAGMLVNSFTKFKSEGLTLSTIAVANAVREAAAETDFGKANGLADLGLTYDTLEEMPSAPGALQTGTFSGLGSDMIYGSAQPYGLAGAGLGSDIVYEDARPYGSGLEGDSEEEEASVLSGY